MRGPADSDTIIADMRTSEIIHAPETDSDSFWDKPWVRTFVSVLTVLAMLMCFGSLRLAGPLFALLGLLLWAIARRKRKIRAVALTLCSIAIAAPFLPVDVYGPLHGPIAGPRHIRLVPLRMGLPRPATLEAARRGDVVLGGCLVSGFEPRYVVIW